MAHEPFEVDESLIAETIITQNLMMNMENLNEDLNDLAGDFQDLFNEC